MGTNSAPEIANLTLYPDEKAFVEQLIEQDLRLAQRHNLNFRLIDDVLTWDEEPLHLKCMDYNGLKRQAMMDQSTF